MKADRQVHEGTWRECFDLSFPERGEGLQGSTLNNASNVRQAKARLLDDTGRDALQTLCAGIMAGVTPSNQQWFDLDAGTESEVEKHWLSEAARIIWQNIHDSNFDAEAMDALSDMGPAGWFTLYIDEAEEGGYEFETWPIAECYYAQSRKAGPVDILYRYYACSVEQLVAEFELSKVSEKTRKAYQDMKFDDPVQVVRIIRPRRGSNGVLAKTMPFESLTLECAEKHLLRESGYPEFPAAVPRWNRLPGSVYATGPFLNALADVKTLNQLVMNELAATDLAVGGMWKGKADGVLNPAAVKVGPRKIIPVAEMDNLEVLLTGSDFKVGWTVKDALQGQIRRALMADQLQPQDKPDMTAYEVSVRVQLIRQRLGPVFGRFQAEWLSTMIERCFGIAYRAGVLGDPPQSLSARAYTVRYKSPLARSQKLEDVVAIEESLRVTGELAAARGGDESVWDPIDLDAAQAEMYEGRGVPMKIMRKKDDIEARREQRAQATEQQRQQLQNEEVQAEVVKQTARA